MSLRACITNGINNSAKWLTLEIKSWHRGSHLSSAVWKASFHDIKQLVSAIGWFNEDSDCIKSLERCSLVVNVYKHGNGTALNKIQNNHPDLLIATHRPKWANAIPSFKRKANYSELELDEENLNEFSEAIIAFWNSIPEHTCDNDSLKVPKWFADALKKDRKES